MQRVETFIAALAEMPPGLGLAVLAGVGLLVALVLSMRRRSARRIWRPDLADVRSVIEAGPKPLDADRDLVASLGRVRLDLRPLLDREELRVAPFLDRAVRDFGRGHRLAMQVPAALLLHPRHGAASIERNQRVAAALDACRLTFVVVDRQSRLTAAVFLGAGPEPLLAEALRLAAVPVIVLDQDWTPEQLKARLREVFSTGTATEPEPLLTAFTGRRQGR